MQGQKRIDKPEILGLAVRFSLPLGFLPPGWPFISIWFVIAFKFFDLCTFSVALLLGSSISVGGSMVPVPMMSVIA